MKERLTGAVILVALIVLLVPELLTGPLRDRSATAPAERSGQALRRLPAAPATAPAGGIASQAGMPVRSYTLRLTNAAVLSGGADGDGAAPRGQPAPAASAAPVAAPVIPPVAPSPAVALGAAAAHPAAQAGSAHAAPRPPRQARPVAARSAASERPAAHPSRAWVVQLGYFSVHANALRLARRLRQKGVRVRITPSRVRGRVLWRVWAGPLSSRAAAAHLARRLRSIGLRGEVLPG